jgi:hypothetical protein
VTEPWREVADRVRNWGKWGASDELGTLNYITPQKMWQRRDWYKPAG